MEPRTEEEGAAAILQRVERATEVLARPAAPSADDVAALSQLTDELQSLVASFSSQRVLELSGAQLMQAGVGLYNAPRAALRALADAEKSRTQQSEELGTFPRRLLVVTRLIAAKIMELSLVCSKEGEKDTGGKRNAQFLDECVDVLRSFGRVGMLMLDSAKIDCSRCEEYLELAKEAFSTSLHLWARIGLSHLTKFKEGLELEDIVDDLWDFCVSRVHVLQLLTEHSDGAVEVVQDVVASIQELKMLVPYKSSYAKELLTLLRSVSDGYNQAKRHELQVTFVEEALGACGSLDHGADESLAVQIIEFKQHVLVNLLRSLCACGDIERAELCFQLIPAGQDPKILLLMVNLYVDNKHFEKARSMLMLLFQQDSFDDSILGARSYARGLSFSEEGLDIYRELLRNYGDSTFEISLEIACNLALHESKQYQAMAELKRLGVLVLQRERQGEDVGSNHIYRVRQTVFDAVQHALNANKHEDSLKWADVGLAVVSTAEDKAMYMRTMSRSCLHLGHFSEASKWADQAFAADRSKKCLLLLFQIELQTKSVDEDNKLTKFIEQLKARDDFEINDLLAMGKIVGTYGADKQDLMLYILDELCDALLQADDYPADLPKGVIIQNAAQLAFSKVTRQEVDTSAKPEASYDEKFLSYANALLHVSKLNSDAVKSCIGPASVFEWFYSMSFEIAKSTEESSYFVLAADIAERSDELYQSKSPLQYRCLQCLLAAVSSDLTKIDTLDKDQLRCLLEVISRYESIVGEETGSDDRNLYFIAKAVMAAKLRLFDADTDGMFEYCQTKLQKSADDFMEIGELVLLVLKFKESTVVRDKYRALSRQLFSYSLQLQFQADIIDAGKLSNSLRRLISLAESQALALEWFQQLLQICESLNVVFSDIDVEWFVAKAWNIGVSCHRGNDMEGAQRFMKIALDILEKCEPLMKKLGHSLQEQYQLLLGIGSTPQLGG